MVLLQHTFMFADLCDFTEYSWTHGDERCAELALRFHRLVEELVLDAGCELVKTIGDAVMIRADDPRTAVNLARRIHAEATLSGLPQVRIGLDSGTAVERAGDWYGTTVNTAARVCKQAGAGTMWMTERTSAAIQGMQEISLVDCGSHALKGLPECLLHAAADVIQRSRGAGDGAGELEPLLG